MNKKTTTASVVAAVAAAAIIGRQLIPEDKQPALDKALQDAALTITNSFRGKMVHSIDWSHADVPDRANQAATRKAWMDLGLTNLPCRARLDEYKGPAGAGWILTLEATPNASRSNRFTAVIATGPESWRTTGWTEVAQ